MKRGFWKRPGGRAALASMVLLLFAGLAAAFPVGERHLVAYEPSAAVRDAHHSDRLRITVWYPAAAGSVEAPLDIGPAGQPLFKPGSAALNAPFADGKRRPVILLSHGYGGTARIMAWFALPLVRAGYIVVAVDHPGNNAMDKMTMPGAILFWERPGDLAAALAEVRRNPLFRRHLDAARLGVAGFSAGGFTALAAAGGRVDIKRFFAFCKAHPADAVCKPQREFAFTIAQADAFLARPDMQREIARSRADLSIPGVKAAFAMAPGIIQGFIPASLKRIHIPVSILLGDADPVVPPATNGELAAKEIPGARITILPGVGHYDFLSECTPAGDQQLSICRTRVPRSRTHRTAIRLALALFRKTLGPP